MGGFSSRGDQVGRGFPTLSLSRASLTGREMALLLGVVADSDIVVDLSAAGRLRRRVGGRGRGGAKQRDYLADILAQSKLEGSRVDRTVRVPIEVGWGRRQVVELHSSFEISGRVGCGGLLLMSSLP